MQHKDFDNAAKEILNLSDRAIIHFLNANFSSSHPPDAHVIRTNTEYRLPVIKLTELSVKDLVERHLLIFAPLYIIKLRKRVKQAGTREERVRLAAELKEIYKELQEALRQERERGTIAEVDGDKIVELTKVLHQEVYGEYNEFAEETMDFSNLRVIEKLHKEIEEERRFREEERRFREEAASRAELDRQRLRNTAQNILRLGLSVEQVTQATGLPRETVQTLAAQL
jgi:hypothetical protein